MTEISGRRLLACVGVWLALVLAALVVTLAAAGLAARAWALHHRALLVAIATAEAYLALLAALMLSYGGPAGLRDRLRFRYTRLRDVALALVTWAVALIAADLVSVLAAPVFGPPQSNAEAELRLSSSPLFWGIMVPTLCLLAPACEELFFRGALFGWLRRHLPLAPALVLTAAIFAGAHLLPDLLPVLFVLGLALTWVRSRTDSTFNSFVMHATQNTVAVIATYELLRR